MTLVKNGRKTLGFVFCDNQQNWQYAFGKPSQRSFVGFLCKDENDGINKIKSVLNDIKIIITKYD